MGYTSKIYGLRFTHSYPKKKIYKLLFPELTRKNGERGS